MKKREMKIIMKLVIKVLEMILIVAIKILILMMMEINQGVLRNGQLNQRVILINSKIRLELIKILLRIMILISIKLRKK